MAKKIIVRCETCGKALAGKALKTRRFGKCPRCGGRFVIPEPVSQESRKYKRTVVGESQFVQPIPATLTQSEDSPLYRVMYTEVPPVEFALKRSTHVPLLDLSEGGMGLLVRADDVSDRVVPGEVFVTEIDFPILVQPLCIQVEVCWIHPIKESGLLHVGVRFCTSNESFKSIAKNLVQYIMSKTETLALDKWGTFA